MEEDTRGFWFRQPRHPRAPKPKVETEEVLQIAVETEEVQEQASEETIEGEVILQTEAEVAEGGLVEVAEEES